MTWATSPWSPTGKDGPIPSSGSGPGGQWSAGYACVGGSVPFVWGCVFELVNPPAACARFACMGTSITHSILDVGCFVMTCWSVPHLETNPRQRNGPEVPFMTQTRWWAVAALASILWENECLASEFRGGTGPVTDCLGSFYRSGKRGLV